VEHTAGRSRTQKSIVELTPSVLELTPSVLELTLFVLEPDAVRSGTDAARSVVRSSATGQPAAAALDLNI
jgi:hypothetical protein